MLKKIVFLVYLAHSALYSKPATEFTNQANLNFAENLNTQSIQDFDDAEKGFIAPLPNNGIIKNSSGDIVWDLSRYNFINSSKDSNSSVNPSLWRQAKLLIKAGLFKVADRIYQIRGADISNMTIIEGNIGIIIVDPLLSNETAQAALSLYYDHRPFKQISAVIYTHSHADHFGGVKGIINNNQLDKMRIIAPQGFAQAAFDENILVGNAMARRATYMYGNLLIPGLQSQIGCGLGLATSTGTSSLILPTELVSETGQEKIIDGIRFVFLMAPSSEAPAEMLFFIPELKALCAAEDATHTMHNVYSLRGTKTRDAKAWSNYLNEAIDMFGSQTEVVFAQHHWPIWGNGRVIDFLEKQRDMYKYIHDQTLRLANQGYTMIEIAEMVKLPLSLEREWYNRGYYGSLNHNVKSVYAFYLGWFDGNPSTLHQLPPTQASKKYIEYMGGPDTVLEKAKKDYAVGQYRWVAQVLKDLVYAYPNNQTAKDLLADTLEQLGYQAENSVWRNFYLTGAQELRNGVQKLPTPNPTSADVINSMPTELLFDYLAIRLNGPKASENPVTLNLKLPDTNEHFIVQIKNGVLHYFKSKVGQAVDFSLVINRKDLNQLFSESAADLKQSEKLQLSGDIGAFNKFLSLFDRFNFWFNIIQPN
jgi:alkyl sulfatase BDS1-like metallo-beta-lactamase superfamily hydrolase